jgi:DNA-binding transcriptional ArsR family regulator
MDPLDFGKALADETRQKIMKVCCCRSLTVTEIVTQIGVTQPTVSHHLKVLRDAGLVLAERHGREIYYTLDQGKVVTGCCQLAEVFAPDVTLEVTQPK